MKRSCILALALLIAAARSQDYAPASPARTPSESPSVSPAETMSQSTVGVPPAVSTPAGLEPAAADSPAPGSSATPATTPSESDVNAAILDIRFAWHDYSGCRRISACAASFETFGVAISFGDGSFRPFSNVQRRNTTTHDCIKNARASLAQGDKALAVQWVMAARIENIPRRDWLGSHPDAVLEALRRCCW